MFKFGGLGGIQKKILSSENFGMVAGILFKPTVDSLLDKFVPQQKIIGNVGIDDIAEMVLGAYLMKKKGGAMAGFGKMLIVLNLANVVGGFMSGGFSLLSPPSQQAEVVIT